MTDATIVVLVAAIPTTIASITAAFVALASLRKSRENGEKTAAVAVKADTIITKAEEIHEQGNSRAAKSEALIAQLQIELLGMRAEMASKAQIAAVLASTSATALAAAVAAPAVAPHGGGARAAESLEHIDAATAETAENTRKTELKVDAMKNGSR